MATKITTIPADFSTEQDGLVNGIINEVDGPISTNDTVLVKDINSNKSRLGIVTMIDQPHNTLTIKIK